MTERKKNERVKKKNKIKTVMSVSHVFKILYVKQGMSKIRGAEQ